LPPAADLTPAQRRAALLLGKGYRPSAIAARLGIAERTLRDWRVLPRFQAAAQHAQEEHGDPDAMEVLRELMLTSDKEEIRLRAATALMQREGPVPPDHDDREPDGLIRVAPAGSLPFLVAAPLPSPDAPEEE
jgi:transposase-like protein